TSESILTDVGGRIINGSRDASPSVMSKPDAGYLSCGLAAIVLSLAAPLTIVPTQSDERPTLTVTRTSDFEVAGTGEHAAWRRVDWTALRRRQPDGHPFES